MTTTQSFEQREEHPVSQPEDKNEDFAPFLSRLLVAVDGSQMADNALLLASQIALKYSAEIDLVHINIMRSELVDKPASGAALHPITSTSPSALVENKELARATILAGEALLLDRKRSLEKKGIKCEEISVSTDTSSAGSEILRICREGRYELVVLGSRGLGGVRSFFLGSVSKKVAAEASCSVLVSKAKIDLIQRILLAYDGSDSSKKALDFVSGFAKKLGASVNIISVISSQMIAPELIVSSAVDKLDEEMRYYASEATSKLRQEGVTSEESKIVGSTDISYAITREAEEGFYDLIVLGNRGWGRVKSFFLGSVASGVLDSARTNVLIVK